MANPGYPMQPNPMMGGPGQMPQMRPSMPMQPPAPVRRGTSKAVPVVVSAGLAVGVFCGLLFGLGTGKEGLASPSKGNNVKKDTEADPKADPGAAPTGLGATAAHATPPPSAGSGSAVAAKVTPPAAGSGSSAEPTIKIDKLTFEIDPKDVAPSLKLSVDGKDITGTSTDVPFDTTTIKVVAKADGFHTFEKTITIVPGEKNLIQFEMSKRSSGGAGSPGFGGASTKENHVPTRPPSDDGTPKQPKQQPKKQPAGGGLIDI